jgi:hypothetical protein
MFIIDEASMVPAHALTAIDTLLRDITGVNCPFGGKIFLLGGDFRQVLPVVPRRPRTVIIEHCIKSSPLWQEFQVHKLTKNMRADHNQQEFAKWLLDLGNGALQCEHSQAESISIPTECNIVEGDIVDDVFPDVSNPNALTNTVILRKKCDLFHLVYASLLVLHHNLNSKTMLDRYPLDEMQALWRVCFEQISNAFPL